MSRIPRLGRLQSLQSAVVPKAPSDRTSFVAARAFSTTRSAQDTSNWVRNKLWKGKAPGSDDPYTQRPQPETSLTSASEVSERSVVHDKRARAQEKTRISIPPTRTEAAAEREVASIDSSYIPATSAEGLEEILPLKKWWEQEGHWGKESQFRGFACVEKTTDKDVVEVYLRRAVAESLALRQVGLLSEWAVKKWRTGGLGEMDLALSMEFKVTDGSAEPFLDPESITNSLTGEGPARISPEERVSPEEARQILKSWNPSWKEILVDEELKFALRKRIYQFTGTLIPDSKLGAAKTVKHVLALAAKPPKAKKLAQVLEQHDIQQLQNVTVHARRVTPIDKEVAVGRWKVIEEELKKRGLPVTGTDGMTGPKEQKWLLGRD